MNPNQTGMLLDLLRHQIYQPAKALLLSINLTSFFERTRKKGRAESANNSE